MRRAVGRGLVLVWVLLASGFASAPADACVPEWGVVSSVTPSSGRHPANAAVVISGYGLGESGLVATVDEVPVALQLDDALTMVSGLGAGYDTLALRLVPPPEPGQQVVISGDVSGRAFTDEFGDAAPGTFLVEYIADEPDQAAPDAPTWWWDVDFYAEVDDSFGTDSCGFYPSVGSVLVTVRLDRDVSVDEPVFVRYSVSPETYPLTSSFVHVDVATSDEFTNWFSVYSDQLTEPVSESRLCVELELLDAAGNASATVERCSPCRMELADRGGPVGWCEPPERECPSENPPETPGGLCVAPEPVDSGTTEPEVSPPPVDLEEPDTSTDAGMNPESDSTPSGSGVAVDAGMAPTPNDAGAGLPASDDPVSEPARPDDASELEPAPDAGTKGAGKASSDTGTAAEGEDAAVQKQVRREPVASNTNGCTVSTSAVRNAPSPSWVVAFLLLLVPARRRARALRPPG